MKKGIKRQGHRYSPDCFVLVVSPDHGLHSKPSARGGGHSASLQARPGFEANGVEVQLHVDVRMRQKAGTQTT